MMMRQSTMQQKFYHPGHMCLLAKKRKGVKSFLAESRGQKLKLSLLPLCQKSWRSENQNFGGHFSRRICLSRQKSLIDMVHDSRQPNSQAFDDLAPRCRRHSTPKEAPPTIITPPHDIRQRTPAPPPPNDTPKLHYKWISAFFCRLQHYFPHYKWVS